MRRHANVKGGLAWKLGRPLRVVKKMRGFFSLVRAQTIHDRLWSVRDVHYVGGEDG